MTILNEQQARLNLKETAQKMGIKNYFIDCGTDPKTQGDILVLIDEDSNWKIIDKIFYA